MPDLTIERVHAPTEDVRHLIAELEAVLSAAYPPEQRHGLALDALFQPHIRFFLARVGADAVGCCGVAFFDGYAELKRMYVKPAVRGRGVAQALLVHIEHEVHDAGLRRLLLETGDKQVAAIRMYERAGFTRLDKFGDYAAMPDQAIATSVFMGKQV